MSRMKISEIENLEIALKLCESTKKSFGEIWSKYKKCNNRVERQKLINEYTFKIKQFYFLIEDNKFEQFIRKDKGIFSYEDDKVADKFEEHLNEYISNIKEHIKYLTV